MKVIQITDDDAKQLIDTLKLETLNADSKWSGSIGLHGAEQTVNSIHRAFHYRVTLWLQKHGADLSR